MGVRDWMLLYADGEIQSTLQAAPALDRSATHAVVKRLYPSCQISLTEDGTLLDQAGPIGPYVYAGHFPGLTIVCTRDAALDRPSQLRTQFLDEAAGRTIYLHAMHSATDWFAYAIWTPNGGLRRALSLSPGSGIIENIGAPLDFEVPFWGQAHSIETQADSYPLPFHPLELGEEALRALFGFTYEGLYQDEDPDLENIVLAGFAVDAIDNGQLGRGPPSASGLGNG